MFILPFAHVPRAQQEVNRGTTRRFEDSVWSFSPLLFVGCEKVEGFPKAEASTRLIEEAGIGKT